MATIRERRPGVWEIRAFVGRDATGRPRQVSRTVRGGKKDAQRLAAELTLRPATGSGGRTVADALAEWIALNETTWSERTLRANRSRTQQVTDDRLGRLPIARLTVADVERWHARLRSEGVGPAAIRNRHSVLRAALDQAVRWGWVSVNVASMARLSMPKRADRAAMSADDVRRVVDAAMSFDLAAGVALRLAAVATARRSELAALRWCDLDGSRLTIDSQIVEVRADGHPPTYTDEPTKTGNVRTVALDASTLGLVDELRAERAGVGPWMFGVGVEPPPPARIGWWFTRARDLSGVDKRWRLHDLRHWGATMGVGLGHDVRTVANRLGHASAGLTLRVYAHALPSADVALAESLGAALDAGGEIAPTKTSGTEPQAWSARWRPVALVDDLDDSAPVEGRITLPVDIAWSGQGEYDLADPGQLRRVYEQVLREGTEEQVRRLVRATSLLEVWDDLVLPDYVRAAWEPWVAARRRAA